MNNFTSLVLNMIELMWTVQQTDILKTNKEPDYLLGPPLKKCCRDIAENTQGEKFYNVIKIKEVLPYYFNTTDYLNKLIKEAIKEAEQRP